MAERSGAIIAYDSTCGPCASFRRMMELLDVNHRLAFVSIAEAESAGMLDALPGPTRWRSFHLLDEGGVRSGARALPEVARLLPFGSVLSRLITMGPGQKITLWLYSTISRLHTGCSSPLTGGSTGAGRVSRPQARSTAYS